MKKNSKKNSYESKFEKLIALTSRKYAKNTGIKEIENSMQNNYVQDDI